jgi:dynamin 1-like protein
LDLTVVDLPGLVKNAVDGQDPRIVEQIQKMVRDIISQKESLILAVTPANDDLANSDSIRIAREVDPLGDRTIGVITKLDLMDAGTNARDVLQNRVYPLKLGYIGVVNRSQSEINEHLPVAEARKRERKFFDESRDYSDLADRCGSAYLVQTLNGLLMEHIRKCMPTLRQRVQALLAEKEAELQGYGDNPTASRGTMNAFVLDVITKYLDRYQELMLGRAVSPEEDLAAIRSLGGSRISRVFIDDFNPRVEALPGLRSLPDLDTFYLMKNHAGVSVPLFTPDKAFHAILFRAIEQLRPPSLELIDRVAALLFDIHAQVEFMELERFTGLADAIRAAVDECIRVSLNPTREYVNGLIDNEKSFINSARPDFKGSHVVNAPKADDPRSRPIPERPAYPEPVGVCFVYGTARELRRDTTDMPEMKALRQIGGRYFDLIREQIKDLVPKAIVKFLVDESARMLRPRMIETIFNAADVSELLHEDPAITRKRIACQAIVDALHKAKVILDEVRAFKA